MRLREAVRAVLPIFLVTRIGVLAAGYFALTAFGWAQGQPPARVSENELLNLPYRYDATWYLTIARDGYRWSPSDSGQQSIAFFPGFPVVVRAVRFVTRLRLLTAAMLTAFVAAFVAFTYLYRLAREQADDEEAGAAVVLMASYPFAVFFSVPYSESLFAAAALGAWFHLRRGETIRGSAWGLLCGLTRPNGGLLSIPLGMLALQAVRRSRNASPPHTGRVWAQPIVAVMPLIGTGLYCLYLLRLTGHPLAWMTAQEAWGRHVTPLAEVVAEWWRTPRFFATEVGATAMVDYFTGWILVAILCATIGVGRRLGAPAAALILAWLLPPLLRGGVLSMGRMTAVLFPLFIWLAAVIPARHRVVWVAAFAIGQTLVAAMFFTWRPVF